MKTTEEILEEYRERECRLAEQERAEMWEWINMPAYITQNEIDKYSKIFLSRRYSQAVNIIISLYVPVYEVESTWRCWLYFVKKDGRKIMEGKASKEFAKQIFGDKSWVEETHRNISFFTKPLNNTIYEKAKTKKEVSDGSI
jgi:cytolysin (calcineurin-like family phosphatase)